jgi:3D (Asp-Asp-Asp) domain-containing protein
MLGRPLPSKLVIAVASVAVVAGAVVGASRGSGDGASNEAPSATASRTAANAGPRARGPVERARSAPARRSARQGRRPAATAPAGRRARQGRRPAATASGGNGARVASRCPSRPVREHPVTRPRWLHGVAITEYYSAPERWFVGRRVQAPGLPGRHRVDWLYSARGVAMQGDGIARDGRHVHIDSVGSGGWVNTRGHLTVPGRCAGRWSRGRPAWLSGGWRDGGGAVTFPLARGGWSRGVGRTTASYQGVTFAPGSSIALHPYRTLAVDPNLIPRGSRVYIPAYRALGGGWFVAQDTGGAIIGHHVDVYRPPPASPGDGGRYLRGRRIYVIPAPIR